MTRRQKLELRASEIRTRLAELGGLDALDEAQGKELDTLRNEYADVERRSQALAIADDAPASPAGDRQAAELRGRCRVGSYMAAALEMRAVDGAEAEFNQEAGIGLDRFPLEMLAPVEERGDHGDRGGRVATDLA